MRRRTGWGLAERTKCYFLDMLDTEGVEVVRRGGFGSVIGVDCRDRGEQMLRGGADVVVSDLAAVDITDGLSHAW